MAYLGTQPNDVKKNIGLYTPSEILQLTKDGSWSGSLELIESQTVSGVSSAIFTSIKENVYNVHFLQIINFKPTDDERDLEIRFFESGVEESASVYQYAYEFGRASGTFGQSKSTGNTHIRGTLNVGNATNECGNSYNYFYNLGDSSKYSFQTNHTVLIPNLGTSEMLFNFGGGVLPQASTVDQIKLYVSSGNFSCTAKLYGVKQI